jgi:GTPase-associated system helical domain
MSDQTQTVMHSEFPRWYREVSVEDNRDRLHRRWSGVATLVAAATAEHIEAMLRIVFRAKSPAAPDTVGRIRQIFKEADDLFDMRDNERELEVLCGSSLAVLMERNDDTAASAALALTTAALNGARTPDLPMNLESLGESAIARIADAYRQRPELHELGLTALAKVTFAKAKTQLQQQFDANGVSTAFDLAAEEAGLTLDSITKQLTAMFNAANKFTAIQDEELNILWWVFGERSEDLNQAFKSVPVKAQPLVFAKELAGLTEFRPGPRSITGLLSRAGLRENKKVTIPESVNACDANWLRSLSIPSDLSPLSQAIHLAIARKLETGDDTSWVSGWASICGLDDKHSFSFLTLGNLFYRERLLTTFAKG